MKLKKVRLILASVFFTLITLLFLDFTGTLQRWFGWMAKVQFLPAVLSLNVVVIVGLIVLTLIFGRIYCSVICPLGIMQDAISRLRFIKKRPKYSYSKALNWLRYTFLAVMIVALIAGVSQIVALLDPYSSFGRIASNLFQPIYLYVNNALAYLAEKVDGYAFYHVDIWMRSIVVLCIAVVTFIMVAILAWRNGRTYCNTVCPVGTVLGLLSRFSYMKVFFDAEKCKKCSKCSRVCKASCIDYKTQSVDYSRCVVCGNCLTECNFGALHYGKPSGKVAEQRAKQTDTESVDKSKRAFLVTSAMLSTAALAQEKMKLDGGFAELKERKPWSRNTPLTPPGSLSAQNFEKHCTACQLCISECPNGVLRPSTDWEHLMQPTMSYERGFCRPECTRCSEVCPTGAIQRITKAEKSSTQIGHAQWGRFSCIVLTDDVDCGNCARHCPSGAIEMMPLKSGDEESKMVPAVDTEYCIGCGACEYVCPARPLSAIHVEGHEVHKEIS